MEGQIALKKAKLPATATVVTLLISSLYALMFEKVPEMEHEMKMNSQAAAEIKVELRDIKGDLKELQRVQLEIFKHLTEKR